MASNKQMPISEFVDELKAAVKRKDGYIMGATGQNPKNWAVNSWWFTQYNGSQKTKALYWREHAARVWDCNGLSEGIYKDFSGVDINTKARYNYANWCGTKGKGTIPSKYRVPGLAVFWGNSAGSIHHVGYLIEPVVAGKPDGDWYLIEARGVMYGVVKTKLNSRKPDFWGMMDKYFDYGAAQPVPDDGACPFAEPAKLLKKGISGEGVRWLQWHLLRWKPDCLPKCGADGDFGRETHDAVIAFQKEKELEVDGIVGSETRKALKAVV